MLVRQMQRHVDVVCRGEQVITTLESMYCSVDSRFLGTCERSAICAFCPHKNANGQTRGETPSGYYSHCINEFVLGILRVPFRFRTLWAQYPLADPCPALQILLLENVHQLAWSPNSGFSIPVCLCFFYLHINPHLLFCRNNNFNFLRGEFYNLG